ncbi:MAG TPA: RluA family pseudouridine synthase [Candidatus Binatia bacterium]|nr:RluA family pseudouridine synthase [Candidatus Binatia bacterium]
MADPGTRRVLVDAGSAGSRLDLFLVEHLSDSDLRLSRSEIQRLITEGQISLNGAKTKASARIKLNDEIVLRLLPVRIPTVSSEDLPLEILYEDMDLIVINKPAGLTVHPAAGNWTGTLVNALLFHCPDISAIGGERRPGIVHRLDKDTSGVIVAVKNMDAYHDLMLQFKNRTVEKEYLGLAWGRVMPEKGSIDRPIGRHRSDRKKMSSLHFSGIARKALTEWRVDRRFVLPNSQRALTLLRLRPHTGRTHQLRVHLADSGYPLVGDRLYGKKRGGGATREFPDSLSASFPRQALHAQTLVLNHVRSGERMRFTAPLPEDFLNLLRQLRAV